MDECTSKTSKESSEIKLSTSCFSSSWIIHSFSQCCMFCIGTSLVYFGWNGITQKPVLHQVLSLFSYENNITSNSENTSLHQVQKYLF